MPIREIKCWDDAGNWDSPQSLLFDSLFNRFSAVWKAVQERYAVLGITHPQIDLEKSVCSGDGIKEWCDRISAALEYLIPHFSAVDEQHRFSALTLSTPFCTEKITLKNSDARSYFQEWDLPVDTPSWGQKYLYVQLVEYSMILTTEEINFSASIENTPLTVQFSPFNAADLLAQYPLDPDGSISDFLWNAYRILKLLFCPVREIGIAWDHPAETHAVEKGFVLMQHPDGTSSFSHFPDYPPAEGTLFRHGSHLSELDVWSGAQWRSSSGDISEMKRDFFHDSDGSGVWIVSKKTAGALFRNNAFLQKSGSIKPQGISLYLIYDRMYRDTGAGYFAPPYPEDEWINAVDDLLPPDGTASFMENEISRPAGGTGESNDAKRHCRLQVEVDLRYASGFKFL